MAGPKWLQQARGFRTKCRGVQTVLYRRWLDMRGRAHGRATKCPWIYPAGWPDEWNDFAKFRTWALAHGFSKQHDSPDRLREDKPYGPDNVVWTTRTDNTGRARGSGYYGAQPAGAQPPSDFVPF
jgi:hypothetical protein